MQDPKDIAVEMLRLTDAQDWAGREALCTDDIEFIHPAGHMRGRTSTTEFSRPFVRAFPEAQHVVEHLSGTGDTAIIEGVWVGRHTGPMETPMGEIPPTGAEVRLRFAAVLEARDDLVSSFRIYFDTLELMAQLGLMPASV